MFETMEEINKDPALKYLIRNCKRYNMPGVFINHNPEFKSKESGIYFITGIDVAMTNVCNYNPVDLMNNQALNSSYFQPVKVFKITDCDPAVLIEDVAMYCWSAEFVAKIFPQYDVALPKHLFMGKLDAMAEYYTHTYESSHSEAMKADFQNGFREIMIKLKQDYSQKGLKRMWHDFATSNRHDGSKNAIRNLMNFLRRKSNRVDFNRVNINSTGVTRTKMELWRYKEFAKEIKKYPEVIYWKDPNVMTDTMGSCKPGTEHPKNGKYKFVSIAYPIEAEPFVAKAYNDAVYKPEATLTAEEIINSKKPYCALVAPESSFYNYLSLLPANNVKFAIDPGYINHPTTETVPILYYKEDKYIMDKIVERLANGTSSFHYTEDREANANRWITQIHGDDELEEQHAFNEKDTRRKTNAETEAERKLDEARQMLIHPKFKVQNDPSKNNISQDYYSSRE